MGNEVHHKTFWYGLCENAWFQWQPFIWFPGIEGRPTNPSYLGSSYPRALELVSN